MDADKLRVLHEVGYEVQESCGLCAHFNAQPGSDFGTCSLHQYDHAKHTGPLRLLSVHRNGRCSDGFEADPAGVFQLGGFADLIEGT